MYSNFPVDANDEIYKDFVKPLDTLIFSGEATSENKTVFAIGTLFTKCDGDKAPCPLGSYVYTCACISDCDCDW